MKPLLQISALHLFLFIRGTESAKMTDKFHTFFRVSKIRIRPRIWIGRRLPGSGSTNGPNLSMAFILPSPGSGSGSTGICMGSRFCSVDIVFCRELSCFSFKFMLFLHPNKSLKTLLHPSLFDTPFRITDWSRMVLKIPLTSYGYVTPVCLTQNMKLCKLSITQSSDAKRLCYLVQCTWIACQ